MCEDVQSRVRAYRYLAEHPEIFDEIGAAAAGELRIQRVLRTKYPEEVVRLALSVAELRRRAVKKFPQAARMWFDRARLEQATPWAVAVHKASRFEGAIKDYCCGLGADAVALGSHGAVTAIDVDPIACMLTELNAAALGVSDRVEVECRDFKELQDRSGLLHVDPDRRAGATKRAVRVEDYVPSVDELRALMRAFRGGAVKLSPAANFGGKFDDVEVELVSLNGEAKEATIWFGALAAMDLWRATVLPSGATIAGDPLSVAPVVTGLRCYLYDPDPAVVRSGMVDLLCAEAGLTRLDPAEESLTSERLVETPFATPFRVLAELPNNERRVRRHLRQAGVGRVEIKARRLPVDAVRLQRSFAGEGGRAAVVIFARIGKQAAAIIAERVAAPG